MVKNRGNKLAAKEITILDRFLDAFVLNTKRTRARKLLLGGSESRIEAIQTLSQWLKPSLSVMTIRSDDGWAEFRGLQGRLFDHTSVSRIVVEDAQSIANGGFGAVFISDDNRVTLLIPEVGEPVLCVRS